MTTPADENVTIPTQYNPATLHSPGRDYGHPACRDRFIVEYRNVDPFRITPFGEIAESHFPRTKRECDATRLSVRTYGRRLSDNVWVRLPYHEELFSWREGRCTKVPRPPTLQSRQNMEVPWAPVSHEPHIYRDVRVAVKATTLFGYKLPVTATLWYL